MSLSGMDGLAPRQEMTQVHLQPTRLNRINHTSRWTVNIFEHLFLSGQWLHILYLYSSLSGSVFLSCMSCISINFKKLWKSVERMAQCSVQGSYGWVRWHAASPCLSRWQLWKISPLSAHRHSHTVLSTQIHSHTQCPVAQLCTQHCWQSGKHDSCACTLFWIYICAACTQACTQPNVCTMCK